MSSYELTVLFPLSLSTDDYKKEVSKLENDFKKLKIKKLKSSDWGKKLLAYPINKLYEAYYLHLTFEAEPNVIDDLRKSLRLNENILRNLLIRLE